MKRFCPNCGNELMEGQQVCPNCGAQQMTMPQMQPQQSAQVGGFNNYGPQQMAMPQMQPQSQVVGADSWKNTKATVGLILGIVSFFIFGFLAFFGLALGISGLVECKQHNNKGKGVAIAAIVVGAICSCLVILNVILTIAAL